MSASNADEPPSDDSDPISAEAERPDEEETDKEEAPDWLIENIAELSQNARSIYLIYLGFLAYCFVTIVGTTDRQILLDESVRLPLVGVDVSFTGFFVIAPLVAIGTFVYLQLYLQRLKHLKKKLGAEYAPVETGRLYPWMLNAVDDPNPGPVGTVQRFAVNMVLWWMLPLLLFLFAIWYLKAQDPVWGWLVVTVMPTIGSAAALYFWHEYEDAAGSLLEKAQKDWGKWSLAASWVVLQIAVFCLFISTALIGGVPPLTENIVTVDVSHQSLVTEQEQSRYSVGLSGKRLHGANLTASTLTNGGLRNVHLEEADLQNARLDSADLREANLEGTDLQQAHLGSADLRDALLNGANLRDAHLNEVNLVRAELDNVYLAGAHLDRADLPRAKLIGVDLDSTRLRSANLSGAHLSGANLSDARLTGANLNGVKLDSANLHRTHLSDTNLGDARLNGANLSDAKLDSANLHEARIIGTNLVSADLRGADLPFARLTGANLRAAKLGGANFKAANLENAVLFDARIADAQLFDTKLDSAFLREATLTGANLFDAELPGTKLAGARLDSANLESANLDGASFSRDLARPDTTVGVQLQESSLTGSSLRKLRCAVENGGRAPCTQDPQAISVVVDALCKARSLEKVALDRAIRDGVEQQCPSLLEDTSP